MWWVQVRIAHADLDYCDIACRKRLKVEYWIRAPQKLLLTQLHRYLIPLVLQWYLLFALQHSEALSTMGVAVHTKTI
jgi:hypothetical protein